MIGDHHGRTAGRATLLVRAVDDILGTHRIWECAWPGGAVPSEQMITNAIADVLEVGPGEGMPSALQQTVLAGCPD
jgi:hypothetical protein